MSVHRWSIAPAVGVLLALWAGSAGAAFVTFNDFVDEVTSVDVVGAPAGSFFTNALGPETWQVTFFNAVTRSNVGSIAAYGLDEPPFEAVLPPGFYSDVVTLRTFADSTTLQLTFESDISSTVGIAPPVSVYGHAEELLGGNTVPLPPGLDSRITLPDGLTVRVVSDVAVPEPSSLVLSGMSALLGLGYLRCRRRAAFGE